MICKVENNIRMLNFFIYKWEKEKFCDNFDLYRMCIEFWIRMIVFFYFIRYDIGSLFFRDIIKVIFEFF